jgi:hypothetical protein
VAGLKQFLPNKKRMRLGSCVERSFARQPLHHDRRQALCIIQHKTGKQHIHLSARRLRNVMIHGHKWFSAPGLRRHDANKRVNDEAPLQIIAYPTHGRERVNEQYDFGNSD